MVGPPSGESSTTPYRTIEIVAGGLCGLYSANSARRLTIA